MTSLVFAKQCGHYPTRMHESSWAARVRKKCTANLLGRLPRKFASTILHRRSAKAHLARKPIASVTCPPRRNPRLLARPKRVKILPHAAGGNQAHSRANYSKR